MKKLFAFLLALSMLIIGCADTSIDEDALLSTTDPIVEPEPISKPVVEPAPIPEPIPEPDPEPIPEHEPIPEPDPEPSPESKIKVYITETGSKYHDENPCGRGNYSETTLEVALNLYLEPCAKCIG